MKNECDKVLFFNWGIIDILVSRIQHNDLIIVDIVK